MTRTVPPSDEDFNVMQDPKVCTHEYWDTLMTLRSGWGELIGKRVRCTRCGLVARYTPGSPKPPGSPLPDGDPDPDSRPTPGQ
jgi:hypothetical protein